MNYILFLSLLFQAAEFFACSQPPKPTMTELVERHYSLSPAEREFVILVGNVAYSLPPKLSNLREFRLTVVGNPLLDNQCRVLEEAICNGNLPRKVPTYLSKREGTQLVIERPDVYLSRILRSSRVRAQSEPMPDSSLDSIADLSMRARSATADSNSKALPARHVKPRVTFAAGAGDSESDDVVSKPMPRAASPTRSGGGASSGRDCDY